MEVNNKDDGRRGGEGQTQDPDPNRKPNPNSNGNTDPNQTGGFKVKSCKGCLYYSSYQNSKSKNPTCVGIPRNLQQVPSFFVGETELEVSKDGRSPNGFKYACVGYSVYLDKKNPSADPPDKTAKLPFCVGMEMLLTRGTRSEAAGHVPAPAQKNEGRQVAKPPPQHQPQPQQRGYKPPNTTMEEFFNRFKRNADLVASGVVKNLYRVGGYVKDTLDDVLNPDRRRPK